MDGKHRACPGTLPTGDLSNNVTGIQEGNRNPIIESNLQMAAKGLTIGYGLLLPIALARGGSLPAWDVLDNPAFEHFYNLEYDQALAGFVTAAVQHPESATIHNHIAQTILYREMFRQGMLQTEMLGS